MVAELAILLGLAAFGVLTGVTSGVMGVGGGTLMVPFLVLAVGFSQHTSEGTSLLVVLPTALVATFSLRRRGIGDVGAALRLGAVGAVSSLLGARLALALPAHALQIVFAVFLGGVGLRFVADGLRRNAESGA